MVFSADTIKLLALSRDDVADVVIVDEDVLKTKSADIWFGI